MKASMQKQTTFGPFLVFLVISLSFLML
jgi:hypothetical protein